MGRPLRNKTGGRAVRVCVNGEWPLTKGNCKKGGALPHVRGAVEQR